MSVNLPQTLLQESKWELTTRREGLTIEHTSTGCSMLGPPSLSEGGKLGPGGQDGDPAAPFWLEGWPWG